MKLAQLLLIFSILLDTSCTVNRYYGIPAAPASVCRAPMVRGGIQQMSPMPIPMPTPIMFGPSSGFGGPQPSRPQPSPIYRVGPYIGGGYSAGFNPATGGYY